MVENIIIGAAIILIANLQHDIQLIGAAEYFSGFIFELDIGIACRPQGRVDGCKAQAGNSGYQENNRQRQKAQHNSQPFIYNKICKTIFHDHEPFLRWELILLG